MKRWLCWLFLAVGLVFLLRTPHRPVSPCLRPQAARDQSVLSQKEFASTWCRALRAASPGFARNRACPQGFSAAQFRLLITDITDEDGPPWLDCRGPPGPDGCSHDLVTSWQAASQVGSLIIRGGKFPTKFLASSTLGFRTRL